jgi:hypothetical protein
MGVTYEQDIAPLVEAHCQSCHVANGIAPFPLTSYAEVFAMRTPVRAAVESRVMPPFLAGQGCTDYQNDIRLSDDEIALFGKWMDQGSTRGTPSSVAHEPPPDTGELPRVDVTLAMAERYVPQTHPDEYRCFVLDWNQTTDKFVTGMRVVPGNPKVVHHAIAFLALPAQVPDLLQADAADPRLGYDCFSDPGRGINNWLGSWAPGRSGDAYPANTGVLVPAGSKVVLQVHYNLQSAPADASDLTQLQLTLEDTVEKPAGIMLWADPSWVSDAQMNIPAFQPDVVHAFSYDPTPVMSFASRGLLPDGAGFQIYSVAMHQHLLGKSSRIEIFRNGDQTQPECLLDIPRWDFHWQRMYRLGQPKVFNPGDKLSMSCRWDNSPAAQPVINGVQQVSRDVNWGEGTSDEMCLGLFFITK